MQSEDTITGVASPHVIVDSTYRLAKGFSQSRVEFINDIKTSVKAQASIEANDVYTCRTLAQNDTIVECPLSEARFSDRTEFLVAVHN